MLCKDRMQATVCGNNTLYHRLSLSSRMRSAEELRVGFPRLAWKEPISCKSFCRSVLTISRTAHFNISSASSSRECPRDQAMRRSL